MAHKLWELIIGAVVSQRLYYLLGIIFTCDFSFFGGFCERLWKQANEKSEKDSFFYQFA